MTQTPEELSVSGLIRRSVHRYRHNVSRYIPAAILSWFFVVVVPSGRSGDIRPIMATGLFCCIHGFYAAVSSLAANRWNQSFFRLAISRLSGHSLSLIAFLAGLFITNIVIAIFVLLIGLPANHILNYFAGFGMICVSVFYLLRFWPVLVILYLYNGTHRWTGSKSGVFWDGPSFGTAWRMTEVPGALLERSLPVLLTSCLLLAPNIIILNWFNDSCFTVYLGIGYFFLIAVPLITQISYDFAETIRVSTR